MADVPTYRNEQTGNAPLDRMQSVMRDLVAALRLIPFLWGGRLVTVHFTAGGAQKVVRHGLGVPAACFVLRLNYDAAAGMAGPTFAEWMPQPTTIDPKQQIALVADNVCTCDLWFYARASKPLDPQQGQSL